MQRVSRAQLGVVLVVLVVVLAGCSGGTGNGADTTAPGAEDDDTTEVGGDDSGTGRETTVVDQTTTAEVSTTEEVTSTEPAGSSSWSVDDHGAALREAGSYTLRYTTSTDSGGMLVATERVDVDTGEAYASTTSVTSRGNFTTEYYIPPNSDTAYKYEIAFNRSDQMPADDAAITELSELGADEESWPTFREVESGETELGSATVYVSDDVQSLSESFRERYDSIESYEWRIWVDDDTGVIAKYTYQISYVDDGRSEGFETTHEIVDLGSTTVEEPDWVASETAE